ncbi:MAG: FGGY-family carbohydrate kinase [Desulfurispora sp.]|uniref:FGGY-family carbohydrate kinase n=1 Tax=Desulfurispora sp. TaxID=3014275 RepID=UPI00404AD4B9
MADQLIISIDVGTQSVRAVLFDLRGNIVAMQKVSLPPWQAPQPGWAEQEAAVFWQSLCQAVQSLWREHPGVKERLLCATLTTQRSTVLLLDQERRLLYPAVLWPDQRQARLVPALPWYWRWLFGLLGQRRTLQYLQAQAEVNWFAAHRPDIWHRTDKVLFLSGYLTWLITGELVDSVGCQVGYLPFDYRRQVWAAPKDWRWHALAVRPEQLPRLVKPGQVLGQVSRPAAAATGMPPGLPLIAAAADKACEVLGAGCLEEGQASISHGTTATINVTSQRYREPLPLLPPYPSAVPDCYNLEVQIYRGFWLISWFIQEFGLPEQFAARESSRAPEEVFDRVIQDIPPGCQGLVVQPYWSPGLRLPGLEARGSVIGFRDVHTRGHFYRALLEGLAFALREGRERLERRTGCPITRLCVSGGGSRGSQVLQITAGVFNMPVYRPHTWETSALGAAVVAAAGMGLYHDVAAAAGAMVRYQEPVLPERAAAGVYAELYQRVYKPLYGRVRPLYRVLEKLQLL